MYSKGQENSLKPSQSVNKKPKTISLPEVENPICSVVIEILSFRLKLLVLHIIELFVINFTRCVYPCKHNEVAIFTIKQFLRLHIKLKFMIGKPNIQCVFTSVYYHMIIVTRTEPCGTPKVYDW